MMGTICGLDCCDVCKKKEVCGGCEKTGGHPFGGGCIAAEHITRDGVIAFQHFKQMLIEEFNGLGIRDLRVEDLNLLDGAYVNLVYQLPNGESVKLLKDNYVYLGNQIEIPGEERCYGIVVDNDYLLVCSYGCGGSEPQIICYKKR